MRPQTAISSPPRPQTIVHVVFSSRIAGGEQHCIDLAHAQAALGHQVHVVGPVVSAVAAAVGPQVRYHGMALRLLLGARLRRLVRSLRADVCHAHLGPACKAVARVDTGVRIGTLHVGYRRHQHARLDGLICVNQAQQLQLGDYGGAACVIHNWAPERTSPPTNLRAELGLHDGQFLIGSVGRLNRCKGMDLLIGAFRTHAPQNAVLAILGEGKERVALERQAEGDARIRLLGFRSDVDAALRSMDLFVSASREDAFPLAILEAMRAGLPVVATATQGPLEMLRGQPATLVPIDDAGALGAAMQRVQAEREAVPRAARQRVTHDLRAYERHQAVQRVLSFYDQVRLNGLGLLGPHDAMARAPAHA